MIPFLFLCYSNGTSIPKESFIREKLSQFGTIESVLMRPSYNSNLKSFVLVEYSTVEEAMACRTEYTTEDENCMKKLKLGDKRLEVNILIGSKVMRPFEANILPSTTSMTFNQSGIATQAYQPLQMQVGTKGAPIQIQSQLQQAQALANVNAQMNNHYMANNINDEIRLIFDEEFIQESKAKDTVHVSVPIGGCLMEEGKNSPIMFETMSKTPVAPKPIKSLDVSKKYTDEIVHQYIEENYSLFWSGFITKGLKNNVGVDGYFLSGDMAIASEEIFTLRIHNMNVSHKSNIEEVLSRPCQALVIMIPSNPTQKARFLEYRNYFRDKKIIGIVNHFKSKILYIFPYYEELKDLLGGLKDGLYMVGMVSEIVKKEEPPVAKPESANQDSSGIEQDAVTVVGPDDSSQEKLDAIKNELAQKTLIEEVDEVDPSGDDKKPQIEVEVEEIENELEEKKMIMDEEFLIDTTGLPHEPPTIYAAEVPIELEEQQTEDLTVENKPNEVTEIEEETENS